jgi:hypothetical protein
MSKHDSNVQEQSAASEQSAAQEQPEVTVAPFNPFAILSSEQSVALIARLNPQWKTAHDGDARIVAVEHSCSHSEALLLVWLRDLATEQLENAAYSRIFASSKAMLEQVAAGSMASLAIIAEDYSKLPESTQRKYRINMRDAIGAKWYGETATRIVSKLMEATGVQPEKEWMR